MFAFIRGRLAAYDSTTAVIDVQGVGFKLGMSTLGLAALGSIGSEVTVYTSLVVREDALTLYGFLDPHDQELFERLLSVSGVGPKVALSALSAFNADTLEQLIIDEDVKRLSTISGMGKKTVQRLILELRGSLVSDDAKTAAGVGAAKTTISSAQAAEALLGMGFTGSEIELALKNYDGPTDDVEQKIRYALKRLGG